MTKVENLSENDFKKINAKTEFKIIFVERITHNSIESDIDRMRILNKFIEDKGALVFLGAGLELLYNCHIVDFKLGHFSFHKDICILVKENGSLENTVAIIEKYLLNRNDLSENVIKNFQLQVAETNRLHAKYPRLSSPLVSTLAYLHTLIKERETRKMRNWFKDSDYQQFIMDMEKNIILFNEGNLSEKDICNKIDAWKIALPSSTKVPSQLLYDSLSIIIDRCKDAVKCHATTLKILDEKKANKKSW